MLLQSNKLKILLVYQLFMSMLISIEVSAARDKNQPVFYRYLNDEGVLVIDHSIPPKYAQNGYQVVNIQGHVLETVEPRLKDSDLAKQQREQELAAWDENLLRRYSTVADVKAAKARRLAEIETSLAILRGNILSMDAQIAREQAKAAERERQGTKVPETILVNIKNIKAEREAAENMMATRQEEYDLVADRFDRDIDRFKVIQERLSQRPN